MSSFLYFAAFASLILTGVVSGVCFKGERCKDEACLSCESCPDGFFQDVERHKLTQCKRCTLRSPGLHRKLQSPCTRKTDAIWGCEDGYTGQLVDGISYCFTVTKTTLTTTSAPISSTGGDDTFGITKDSPTSPSASHSSDSGNIVFGIIGGIICIVILGLVIIIIFCYRRHQRRNTASNRGSPEAAPLTSDEVGWNGDGEEGINEGSPTATTSNRGSPTATTSNRGSPTATASNRGSPTPTTSNRGSPTASNRGSPTPTTSNRGSPTASNRGSPTPTTSNRGSPTAGNQGSPTAGNQGSPTAGNQGSPAAGNQGSPTAGNQGSPAAGNQGSPTAGNQGSPTAGNQGSPTAGNQGSPTAGNQGSPAAGNQGSPTAGNQGSPAAGNQGSPTAGNQGSPTAGNQGSPTAGNQGSPAAGNQGSPTAGNRGSPTAGNQGSPAAGNQGSPAAGNQGSPTAGNRGSPAAGNQESPTAGNQGSPTAGNQGNPTASNQGSPTASNQGSPTTSNQGNPTATVEEDKKQTLHAPGVGSTQDLAGRLNVSMEGDAVQGVVPNSECNTRPLVSGTNLESETKGDGEHVLPITSNGRSHSSNVTALDLYNCLKASLNPARLCSLFRTVLKVKDISPNEEQLKNVWVTHITESQNPSQVFASLRKLTTVYYGFPKEEFFKRADIFMSQFNSKKLACFLFENLEDHQVLHLYNLSFNKLSSKLLTESEFLNAINKLADEQYEDCLNLLIANGKEIFPEIFKSHDFKDRGGQSYEPTPCQPGEIRHESPGYRLFAYIFDEIGHKAFENLLLRLDINEMFSGTFKMSNRLKNKVKGPDDTVGYVLDCALYWVYIHPGWDHLSVIMNCLKEMGENRLCDSKKFIERCEAADGSKLNKDVQRDDTQCKTVISSKGDGSGQDKDVQGDDTQCKTVISSKGDGSGKNKDVQGDDTQCKTVISSKGDGSGKNKDVQGDDTQCKTVISSKGDGSGKNKDVQGDDTQCKTVISSKGDGSGQDKDVQGDDTQCKTVISSKGDGSGKNKDVGAGWVGVL